MWGQESYDSGQIGCEIKFKIKFKIKFCNQGYAPALIEGKHKRWQGRQEAVHVALVQTWDDSGRCWRSPRAD